LTEEEFDLHALIEDLRVMFKVRTDKKGLALRVDVPASAPRYVRADQGKLRQILINLLGNAVKFTDEGGVTIRCGSDPIPEEPKRCHIVIEIEDTGPGIEPARQARIFEPFVQATDVPVRRGTGLGLSICKKYADFMSGTIELESEVGKGSLFRVRLPAEIAEAADVKTPVDDKPRVIGLTSTQKTWRILVADDNRANLRLLQSLLEGVGFFVLLAKNGKEAVAAFKKDSPDLIWMDMRMPVMDGYEATRRIRKWEAAIRGQKTEDRSQRTEVREQREEGEKLGSWEGENKSQIPPGRRPLLPLRLPAREQSLQLGEAGGRNPKSKMEGIPIIAITASAFDEQRPEVLASGCDDMVIKPFRAHEIFEVMGRFLDLEYIYEPEGEAAPDRVLEAELTTAMLADLPAELLQE
jgi:CheY-like chemotaxis protein/anti-sigma regulatory factor (Ser/Thr protein kinase)